MPHPKGRRMSRAQAGRSGIRPIASASLLPAEVKAFFLSVVARSHDPVGLFGMGRTGYCGAHAHRAHPWLGALKRMSKEFKKITQ